MRIAPKPTRPDIVGLAEAPLIRDAIELITSSEKHFNAFSGDGIVTLTHTGGHLDLLLDNLNNLDTTDQARALLPRLSRNLVPVTVTVELALDADAWLTNYGGVEPSEVREDMRDALRDAVAQFVTDWIDSTGNVGNAIVKAGN